MLDLIKSSKTHQTAESIHNKLIKIIPNVSKMTVYRNLKYLANNNEILEFNVAHVSHYCGTKSNHFHFACTSCDEVVDNKVISSQLNEYLKSSKFSPISSGLVIKGVCEDCNQKNRKI